MKLKAISLILLVLLTVFLLASCILPVPGTEGSGEDEGKKPGSGEEGENNEESEEPKDLIYDADSELYIIVDPSIESNYLSQFVTRISEYRTVAVQYAATDSEKHKHEIVIGNLDRAISGTASDRLDRIVKNTEDEYSFLVYSDGSSIALVWDEDEEGVFEELALRHLCENYIKEELIMPVGTDEVTLDIIEDYYRPMDEEYRTSAWADFEKKYGKELADAFKTLYGIYSSECIVWLANLYDSDICVCIDLYGEAECSNTKYCGTGGFYFSNSGRDTMGFLPDAESTGQAIGLLGTLGLAYNRGGDPYYGVLTEDMREKIGNFAYALEESNGYFYHPQWSRELVDSLSSRRSRDMGHCEGILLSLGRKPKYTTASGVKGEDALGTSSHLEGRLGKSVVSAVSAVMLASSDSCDANLQDVESFKRYLNTLNITLEYNSYPVGNTLTAMTPQIKERDRQIGTADDPTPLMDYLIEWLNGNQNPENGTWAYIEPDDPEYDPYMATNGLLKVSGVYKAHGVTMPHSKESAISCMTAIMADAPSDRATDIYNLWYALINITDNLRAYGGAEGIAEADAIVAELRGLAADAILLTREKISDFVRSDGSGSYYKDQSCPVSQGAPVAAKGPVEGDVNGTLIIVGQMSGLIAGALDVPKVPLFGEAERAIFRKTIAELGPVVKNNASLNADPIDFENDEIGEVSDSVAVSGNGSALVVKDPTGSGMGNVTHFISGSGSGDTVKINNTNNPTSASVYVFEGDFCVNRSSAAYAVQLTLGSCYMLTFKNVSGELQIWESSSAVGANSVEEYLNLSPALGEWFRLRIEYYVGDHDSVRIKVYADEDLSDGEGMKLYAVSDNYYDGGGVKVYKGEGTPSESFTSTSIFALSGEELDMYIDNLNSYKDNKKYEPAVSTDAPYINVDPPASERVTYGFDGGSLPDGLKSEGTPTLTDGELILDGGDALYSTVNVRGAGAKCAYFEANFVVEESTPVGSYLTVRAIDGNKAVFDLQLVVESDGQNKYLSAVPKGSVSGMPIEGSEVALGERFTLSLEYFHDGDIVILYLDGEFVGAFSYLYADGIKSRVDSFAIIASEGASVRVDDLVSEMKSTSFDDAVAPKLPSRVHDFEENDGSFSLDGSASITSYGSDGVLKLDPALGEGSAKLSINARGGVVNKAILKFEISYLGRLDGVCEYVELSDKSGNVILKLALVLNDEKIEIFEVNKSGIAKSPLYTYGSKSSVEIYVEVYTEKRTVRVLSSGKAVAESGVFIGGEHLENGIATLTIATAENLSAAVIDDLQFESLYGVYTKTEISSGASGETDITSGLDFEASSSGNLPASVKNSLVSTDASLGITNIYNGVTEEYSNVLAFGAIAGTNDAISFVKNSHGESTATVFEADLMLDLNSEGYAYQLFFADAPSGNTSYLIQLEYRSGKVIITDNSSSNNHVGINHPLKSDLNAGEWFNLRVEYYKSTSRDALRVKIFVNGELISVSNNFYGKEDPAKAPGGLINSVSFYSFNATDGFVYIDNLSFKDFNGICNDEITE